MDVKYTNITLSKKLPAKGRYLRANSCHLCNISFSTNQRICIQKTSIGSTRLCNLFVKKIILCFKKVFKVKLSRQQIRKICTMSSVTNWVRLNATEKCAKVYESILFRMIHSKFSFGNLKLEISIIKINRVLTVLLQLIVKVKANYWSREKCFNTNYCFRA